MDKQRILKEAQAIAKKFSFWMVSGNIAHLYGYVYEIPEKKYELEIKFDEKFPVTPPQLIFHNEIKDLLGDNFELDKLLSWSSEFQVIDVIDELKIKIQKSLKPVKPVKEAPLESEKIEEKSVDSSEDKEFITPDLDAYPPDFQYEEFFTPSTSDNDDIFTEQYKEDLSYDSNQKSTNKTDTTHRELVREQEYEESPQLDVAINTELSLIQQEYAYDQIGQKAAEINIYITITLAKTFIIKINFNNYPKRPDIQFPKEVEKLLGGPQKTLNSLKEWNPKNPLHIIDILHEIEKKLFFIKEIESQTKKIFGEYQSERDSDNLMGLKVKLLTYGFKEYIMNIDLETYPNPPTINLPFELEQIINVPITELKAYKTWIDNESEPLDVIREIAWLVDKNSRINFEIDLIKDHYNDLKYDPVTTTLTVDMKGKMKTEDLTFKIQIDLPEEYPMKIPEIQVLNEFELEAHEKIKKDLHNSFDDFFDKWSPFSYLIDLFNLISKKIFEVSVVSCVICHKIECPICSKKIAGDESCHAECPHCNRAYHQHCWEQTIKSFGKCGFCLR
ncbi:MAG: hypothetical protein ACW96S_07475 [Promethearchaeota archaeon]